MEMSFVMKTYGYKREDDKGSFKEVLDVDISLPLRE